MRERSPSSVRWSDVQETLRLDDVEAALELANLREAGEEHWASCPLPDHPSLDESATNFSINAEKLMWKCFVCDEGGNLPQLVMAVRDMSYADAVTWLGQFSDADVSSSVENFIKQLEGYATPKQPDPYERGSGVVPWYPADSLTKYEEWLRTGDPCEDLLLSKWRINLDTARKWHLGYDAKHERHGYVGPALIIPHCFGGELAGWQERWLQDDRPKNVPKYTNSSGFPRANTIFGWDRVDGRKQKIVVVESVMTVIRLWQESIPAVATFGGSMNAYQRRLLATCARGIIYAPDEGAVGEKATRAVLSTLSKHISVEIARPTDKAKGDLADLETEEIWAVLADATPAFLA